MNVRFPFFETILPHINIDDFSILHEQPDDSYFPYFVKEKLTQYAQFFKNTLNKHVDKGSFFYDMIIKINNVLIKTIDLYYEGKIKEASNVFSTLIEIVGGYLLMQYEEEKYNFFRARKNENKNFNSYDLFHVDFKLRHTIPTNRFSIPGFPSLYMGDTTYVCWEEFDRYKFEDLSFVRLENKRKLKIFAILRIEDLLKDIEKINDSNGKFPDEKATALLCYFITYPIMIASAIKVKNPEGHFKPEYIIPQMLLQLFSADMTIDGIKYPSSKVNYDLLHNVQAYNYVFPVKKTLRAGLCADLVNTFHLTEPTSWGIEELMGNDDTSDSAISEEKIALTNHEKRVYSITSFGKLEERLKNRTVKRI